MELSHQVSMVILLDPRSLLPMDVNVEKAFEDSGKPLGCAFRLAGTGDGDALFRGFLCQIPICDIEEDTSHVLPCLSIYVLILEDPCMSLQTPTSKMCQPNYTVSVRNGESIDTCALKFPT